MKRLEQLEYTIKSLCGFRHHEKDVTLEHVLKALKVEGEKRLIVTSDGLISPVISHFLEKPFAVFWEFGVPLSKQNKDVQEALSSFIIPLG